MIKENTILENYEKHRNIIKMLDEPRQGKILKMVDDLSDEYIIAPASSRTDFHNSFPGGYVAHVNNVVNVALKQTKLYKELGGTINFSEEELVFSALFHDLGKIGKKGQPNYLDQEDKWRKEKIGENYKHNEDLDFMLIPHRSIMTLNNYGIPISQNEFIAIMCHDGLYEDANKPYYLSNRASSRFKSNLPEILHISDLIASKLEREC